MRRTRGVVAVSTILVLAGCGAQAADEIAAQGAGPTSSPGPQRSTVPPPQDGNLCAVFVEENVPDVQNDGGKPGELVLNKRSTTAGVNRWMAERSASGGPSETLSSFEERGLDSAADPTAPFSVCVFKVDPRPIPGPPRQAPPADGVSVFVQGTGAFVVEAIGPVAGLVARFETMAESGQAAAPSPTLTDPPQVGASTVAALATRDINIRVVAPESERPAVSKQQAMKSAGDSKQLRDRLPYQVSLVRLTDAGRSAEPLPEADPAATRRSRLEVTDRLAWLVVYDHVTVSNLGLAGPPTAITTVAKFFGADTGALIESTTLAGLEVDQRPGDGRSN